MAPHPWSKKAMELDQYLKAQGLSEAKFAEIIGTVQYNVNRWRRGRFMPSPRMILVIEDKTGGKVTARDFVVSVASKKGAK